MDGRARAAPLTDWVDGCGAPESMRPGRCGGLVQCSQKRTWLVNVIRPLLAAAGRWLSAVRPERRHLRADLLAGLPGAISSIPDGMAARLPKIAVPHS